MADATKNYFINDLKSKTLTNTGSVIFDSTTFVIDSVNHRVGIGTDEPTNLLTLKETDAGTETIPLFLDNRDSTIGSAVSIGFSPFNGNTVVDKIGAIRSGTSSFDLFFSTWDTALTERMRILGNGNVGIGTSFDEDPDEIPTAKLNVKGDIEIGIGSTGTIYNYNQSRSSHGYLKLYEASTGNATLGTTFSSGDVILQPGSSGNVVVNNGEVMINAGRTVGCTNAYHRYNNGSLISYINGVQILNLGSNYYTPQTDNNMYLGMTANRWKIVNSYGGNFAGDLVVDDDLLFADVSTGRVGIGTDTPSKILEIKCVPASGVETELLKLTSYNSTSGNAAALAFGSYAGASTTGKISNVKADGGDYELRFSNYYTSGGLNSLREDVRIDYNGVSITNSLTVNCQFTGGTSTQTLTASNTIDPSNVNINITASEAITVTGTNNKVIDDTAPDGTIINIINTSIYEITLDNFCSTNVYSKLMTKSGSPLVIAAKNFTAGSVGSALLRYCYALGYWCEI